MLTKTDFRNHIECPIFLWLTKKWPDLLPPQTEELKRIFAQGNEVDALARKLFPGGIEVQGFNKAGAVHTEELMEKGETILFQPTAISPDGLEAKADILKKGKGDSWDLYEVKMSAEVKEEHFYDVAFQKICFTDAGIKIGKTFLVHLNGNYVRRGAVDPKQLFKIENITAKVDSVIDQTRERIAEAESVITGAETIDELLIQKCHSPEKCDYLEYYIHGFPEAFLIADKIFDRHLKALLKRGIIDADKVSPEILKKIGYVPEVPFREINKEGIRSELSTLKYPLYFFDYETYSYPIPPFDGTKPFQQIPFQYSLHIKETPDSELLHKEFLARDYKNSMAELLKQLKNDFGTTGSVLVWYCPFEMARNVEMAATYPEYADFLNDINSRIFDLMLIFKFKRNLYLNSRFNGSASLKKVLPVVCPELSYDDLEIHEGETASASWPILADPKTSAEKKESLAKAMLEYCGRDTMAMVAIMEHLEKEIEKG